MSHTPGPWSLHLSEQPWRQPHSVWIKDYEIEVPTALNQPEEDDMQANARLIASAPELLATLRAFLFAHDTKTVSQTLIDRVEAVIAKAEGK